MTDTQAPDVVVTEADIVATADLFEAMHDKAAAWAVRSVGLCGTVHHATAEFLARHRLSTQSAMQARIEELEAGLRKIANGVERRLSDGTTEIDDHPEAMEIARAALSSAIGEPYEFSGWVEVVEEDRG